MKAPILFLSVMFCFSYKSLHAQRPELDGSLPRVNVEPIPQVHEIKMVSFQWSMPPRFKDHYGAY
ncbi:MAG: hypothetical protein ACOYXT_01110, partial [Bacteroidota bacterium]